MARFGQQFLSQLGNPAGMLQGAANLGGAIGGVPGQIKEKRKEEALQTANAGIMENIYQQKPEELFAAAKILNARGSAADMQRAMELTNIAQTMMQAQKKRAAQQTLIEFGTEKGAKLRDPTVKQDFFIMARANKLSAADAIELYNNLAPPIKTAGDKYKVVPGRGVFNTETGQLVDLGSVAEDLKLSDLRQVATPESVIEYIQGGDKNVLVALGDEEKDKNTAKMRSALTSTDGVLTTIDQALGLTEDYWVVGYDLAKYAPVPTDAKQMETYVKNLTAHLAFDRLQEMRDNSKTGGALGQVSERELDLLGSSVANLDPASKNFPEQLAVVRRQYENFRNGLLGLDPDDPKYVRKGDILYYEESPGKFIDLNALAEGKGT